MISVNTTYTYFIPKRKQCTRAVDSLSFKKSKIEIIITVLDYLETKHHIDYLETKQPKCTMAFGWDESLVQLAIANSRNQEA